MVPHPEASSDAAAMPASISPAPVPRNARIDNERIDMPHALPVAPASADTPGGPIVIERGWVSTVATVRGRSYRVVNTHLEVKGDVPELMSDIQHTIENYWNRKREERESD